MFQKPKAIVFDWDNTLVDSWNILHLSLNHTLNVLGKDTITLEQMKSQTFLSMKDIFPRIFGDTWQEAATIYRKTYLLNNNNLKFIDNAIYFLKLLHSKTNIYLAIVSNKSGDILRNEVNFLGVDKYFQKIVGSGDARADKPSPLTMKLALSNSNLRLGEDIWYLGDTEGDMDFAYKSKCKQIFLGYDLNISYISKYKSLLIFHNYKKLINYFNQNDN